ncbi:DUF6950 family protein [Sphingomonas sp. Leaf37]|uniref:DUF6950 family protein n=1 Tax=Sphingomonas sp. Leaf37 TaxID=2876552 RepID=UPI001E4FC7F7|nr:hypothetical protein [Sphingomonas sp. Leaf37]
MARDIDAFAGFIAGRSAMPFAWGRKANDCVGFILAGIMAQTGQDPLPDVTWTTERGAARVIRQLGGLETALDQRLRPILPALAQRGDVAGVFDHRFGVSLLFVEGLSLVGPGGRGLKRLPRSTMTKAWSIDV